MAMSPVSLDESHRLRQEIRRSNVRINVTYILTWSYVLGVIGVIAYTIIVAEPSKIALGLLAGLSSASLGVIGFWFGGRKLTAENSQTTTAPAGPGNASPQESLTQAQMVDVNRKIANLMTSVPPPGRPTGKLQAR